MFDKETKEHAIELYKIGIQMHEEGFYPRFIKDAVNTAIEYEGVYDLMLMWQEERNEEERKEITNGILELIDDCNYTRYYTKIKESFVPNKEIESWIKKYPNRKEEIIKKAKDGWIPDEYGTKENPILCFVFRNFSEM